MTFPTHSPLVWPLCFLTLSLGCLPDNQYTYSNNNNTSQSRTYCGEDHPPAFREPEIHELPGHLRDVDQRYRAGQRLFIPPGVKARLRREGLGEIVSFVKETRSPLFQGSIRLLYHAEDDEGRTIGRYRLYQSALFSLCHETIEISDGESNDSTWVPLEIALEGEWHFMFLDEARESDSVWATNHGCLGEILLDHTLTARDKCVQARNYWCRGCFDSIEEILQVLCDEGHAQACTYAKEMVGMMLNHEM
jgi:hypothetical protein